MIPITLTTDTFADDAIGREANELKKLSDRYRRADTPDRRADAKALEQAAFILSSGGTLDENPRATNENRHPNKSHQGQERRQESTERERSISENVETEIQMRHDASKGVTSDEFADLVSRMRTETRDHSETESKPSRAPRRMTEAELRDHLIAEERKINERERRAKDRSKITLDDLSSESEVPAPSIGGPADDSDELPHVSPRPQLGRDSQNETHQPKRLSEQELREALNEKERKMTTAERNRQSNAPEKPKNRGIDFGFD